MRNFIVIGIMANTVPFLDVPSASAEGLNGEQIKKLLIGNTVFRETLSRKRRSRETWIYFKNVSAMGFKQQREKKKGGYKIRDFDGSWSVTAAGKICWQGLTKSARAENCGNNLRVVGDTVKLDGLGGLGKRKWTLLKGNPEGL